MLSRVASKNCSTLCHEMDFKVLRTAGFLARGTVLCVTVLVGAWICVACLATVTVTYGGQVAGTHAGSDTRGIN